MRRVADNIFFLFMVLTFVSGCRSSAELEYVNNMTARISLECGDVLLIPMQDDAPEATVSVLDENNGYMRSYSARLAVDTTDSSFNTSFCAAAAGVATAFFAVE